MSLADELIADLDDLGGEEEIDENNDENNDLLNDLEDLDDLEEEDNNNQNAKMPIDPEEEKEMAIKVALTGKDDIQSIAKLASSKQLKEIMEVNVDTILIYKTFNISIKK